MTYKTLTIKIRRAAFYLFAFFSFVFVFSSNSAAATRTWDGGGATNNWSTAANWSDDAAPTNADDVVFDGASVKNSTIDITFTVKSIQINSGYTGTITQGADANLTVNNSFIQSAGAFQGSGGTLTINAGTTIYNGTFKSGAGAGNFGAVYIENGLFQQGGGDLTINGNFDIPGGIFQGSAGAIKNTSYNNYAVSGGTFQGGTGAISAGQFTVSAGVFSPGGDVVISRYQQTGGTFNASPGTMTVVADWTHTAGGTFNAGTGTVKFTGYDTFNCANNYGSDVNVTETFYNLEIANAFCNRRSIGTGDTLIVNNNLRLTAASIQGGRIRPLGTTSIEASNNGYVGSTIIEYVTPNRAFVIDNPSQTTRTLPIEMNAANSTLTSSGTGRLNVYALDLINGTVNQGAGIWDLTNAGLIQNFGFYRQSGGAFNGSAAALNVNPQLSGGFFNGGTGLITSSGINQSGGTFSTSGDVNAVSLVLTGGIFNAPSGVLTLGDMNSGGAGFSHTTATGTFNHNNGTVRTFPNGFAIGINVNSTENFNNLIFNGTNTNMHAIGAGDALSVSGTLTFAGRGVNGGSIVANGNVVYTTLGGYQNATTLVKFQDAATRTITFSTDCTSYFQPTLVDNPNITINSGCDTAGAFLTWTSLDLRRGIVNAGNARSGFSGDFTQSGGTFNAGNNTISPATSIGGNFTLSGGTFNAAPSTAFGGNYTHTAAGGNFVYGAGTVIFNGIGGTIDVAAAENFNNIRFEQGSTGTTKTISGGDTLIANGDVAFNVGYVSGGTIEAKKNVGIGGGNLFGGGSTALNFTGAIDQTYTNAGGITTSGTWTVNKPNSARLAASAFAPAAPTSLLISGNVGNNGSATLVPLNVVSGAARLTGAFNLALASLDVANGSSFANLFGGTITLGGNVMNNGLINLDGGGTDGCGTDTIALRSTSAAQRAWSGAGTFRLVDVNVQNQGGTAPITVFSGTNAGSNGTNFTFDASCLSPTAASVVVGGRVSTANGRGIGKAQIVMIDVNGNARYATTNPFGFYRFAEVSSGATYVLQIRHKTERFANQSIIMNITEEATNVNFVALER